MPESGVSVLNHTRAGDQHKGRATAKRERANGNSRRRVFSAGQCLTPSAWKSDGEATRRCIPAWINPLNKGWHSNGREVNSG